MMWLERKEAWQVTVLYSLQILMGLTSLKDSPAATEMPSISHSHDTIQ